MTRPFSTTSNLLLFMVWLLLACGRSTHASGNIDFSLLSSMETGRLLDTVRIYDCSEPQIDLLLPELHRRFPVFHERIRSVALMFRDAPYSHDPLTDEYSKWLPYRHINCTLFVLCAAAFAHSRSIEDARIHMRRMHYRNKKVSFISRYHFTSDRITDSENNYFSVITDRLVTDTRNRKTITLSLNKQAGGGYFFSGRLGGWSKSVCLSYLPKSGFKPEMIRELPAAVGAAFIKKENLSLGVIIGHEGLIINGDLFHASPEKGVCIEKDYFEKKYISSRWEGVVFFSINEVPL